MGLAPGASLGQYRIEILLGAGGMGEVYRARDTKLNRDVAIKVLLPSVVNDPERIARFSREAQVLASLNHPNIAHIHGLEETAGVKALVLEFVGGEDMAARITRGPLPLDEALPIAQQIAGALEAAHEQGIVHRDLKPANIKVRADGTVKVLDFGLAKALEPAGIGSDVVALMDSPTITSPARLRPGYGEAGTQMGVILGTAPYMSPEQARGRAVDKRADIWAFGCVLYEMLTGHRAFAGADVSETLASVIKGDPDWSRLPATTPAGIRRLLKRCVEKNLTRRLQAIGDARIEIDDALAAPETDDSRTTDAPPARGLRRPVPLALTLVLAFAAIIAGTLGASLVIGSLGRGSNQQVPNVTKTLISVAPADHLRSNRLPYPSDIESLGEGRPSRTAFALSPDGQSLVFSAARGDQQQLYLRKLDELTAAAIAGTEGGGNPFFSADGQWVGFWANGALKKVGLTSGGATTICKTPETEGLIIGASWGSNDTIVFARLGGGGLLQVPAAGGVPHPLTKLDATKGETSHRLPQVLPGSGAVLFTVTSSGLPNWDEARVAVQSLVTSERKDLLPGTDARYVPSGHLVFVRAGALLSVPFDPVSLQVTGGPVNMVSDVMQAAYIPNQINDSGAGQFSVSASGALVYVKGGMLPDPERSLLWVGRTGVAQPVSNQTRPYWAPRLSPDGQRLLFWTSGRERNVWIYDIARGTATRLMEEGRNAYSQWSPDGLRVAFNNDGGLFWRSADGTGTAERLTTSGLPSSWSPEGPTLAFMRGNDIWALQHTGTQQEYKVTDTKSNETHAEFSPDGQWLAYTSNESGRQEVFVQPYPGPGPKQQVSKDGGFAPAWRRDGREFFYQVRGPGTADAPGLIQLMAVQVRTHPTFDAGPPKMLFQRAYPMTQLPVREYDVTADGRRFLVIHQKERPPIKATEMILVQNWVEELKRRVPAK